MAEVSGADLWYGKQPILDCMQHLGEKKEVMER